MTNQQSTIVREAVRSYKLKHDYNIKEFLEKYREVLQKAIDEIWNNIEWKEDVNVKRILPKLPDHSKLSSLRNILLVDWPYARAYVDSAIKEAYRVMKSWMKKYIKGDADREKPIIKKKFARVRKDLYVFRDNKIRVCIIPGKEYLEFDISKAWFLSKIPEGAEVRELLLTEEYLIIPFTFGEEKNVKDIIAWDLNIGTLDGFNPKLGWIRVDLTELFHIHRVYELKRQRLQSLASKKPSIKKILKKYSMRERNRAKDFLHKLTTEISKRYADYIHVFEDLEKEAMLNDSREHNRIIKKSNWKTIVKLMSYKSSIMLIDPKNTTKQCSRCGAINEVSGITYKCSRCGLEINRHLNSAINIYMNAKRLKPSIETFRELTKNIKNLLEPTTIIDVKL
ncbi:MAG: transposase [Nitrososphaerota archaeon]